MILLLTLAYLRRALLWLLGNPAPEMCEFPYCWKDSVYEHRIKLERYPWWSDICKEHYDWLYEMQNVHPLVARKEKRAP